MRLLEVPKKICKVCNRKVFARDMLPGQVFCSSSCLIQAQVPVKVKVSSNTKLSLKNRIKYLNDPCPICHEKVDYRCRRRPFCSKKCKRIHKNRLKKVSKPKPQQKIVKIDLRSEQNIERWRRLRYEAIRKHGKKCMACGASGEIHVDHIKPKSKYPELAFNLDNLQILCRDCNYGKSNLYEDDWR